MVKHMTETEKMISDAAMRAYAKAAREVWAQPDPIWLDRLFSEADRIGRAARALRRAALERSEG
ncbi:hypothetical protein [Rhizobium sp. P007]|uniref:hypothetical protein n=1 Tax=Rhizobium sp. P007 TaxID=285908 RepID=UPI00115A7E8A|nr:hypothetical protein [Rhizobium sp. P007]CAD7033941.1 hypothetical protein RP007_04183 [Rhizobium sp. P007]